MKAIVCPKYGPPDIMELKEVNKPTPKSNEVLIKIHAIPVTMGDCEVRASRFHIEFFLLIRLILGIRKPKSPIQGAYLSGVIEEVGNDVKDLKVGDEVFGSCGIKLGANAEYVCLTEKTITVKPINMSFEEAATVPIGGLNALHFLQKANIQNGESILIIGAGGSIGTYGIQLAKLFGAKVTAIDSSEKLDYLKEVGADEVIDYRMEDFTKTNNTYDIIFDVIGKSSFTQSLKHLNKNGRYLLANPRLTKIIKGIWTSFTSDKKVIFELADEKVKDLIYLKELIEDGKLKAFIDRRYSLEDMPKAHRYVENGLKKGDVIINVC